MIVTVIFLSDDLYVASFETDIPSTIHADFPNNLLMNVNVWNQNQAGTTIAANTDGTNFILKVKLTMLYIKRRIVN